MTRNFLRVLFVLFVFSMAAHAQGVDPLTGRAIIDLPLGGISAKDLSASVSLSHQGGALQVSQGPGNAGMGWNISFGGQITREVRGLPDELNANGKTGWLYNGNAASIQGLGATASYSFISGLGYVKDSEPDIFYFSAPGISGKFLFGADGQIKLIPYQDLKITGSPAGTFTIQTNNGLLYTFSVQQSSTRQSVKVIDSGIIDHYLSAYNNYLTPVTYTSSWHLSSIASQISNETMSFTYETGEEETGGELFKIIQPNPGVATTQADSLFSLQEKSSAVWLTQINLKNYSITIDWASALVNGITILESESGENKKYLFEYRNIYIFCLWFFYNYSYTRS
ncbi:MAG: hypothetical protein ACK5PC_18590 [Cyclobacteriaceae bacterium]|jgi:hypothetical protein